MAKQLQEVINDFIAQKSRYRGYDTNTVRNLLTGTSSKETFWLLISDIKTREKLNEDDIELYRKSVKNSVTAYSSNKDSAINIFKKLTVYVEKEMKCSIPIQYPPIPVSNTFERLMFMAKYFHKEENTVGKLKDILWVSDRTIESDLAKLRGQDDPLQICGRMFKIDNNDVDRNKGSMRFKSTIHPFFLTCNLTQVVAMLKGLDSLSEKPEWRGYTKILSEQIWEQLSEYGKERIKTVLTELMPEERGLIDRLEKNESERSFYSESECSRIGQNAIFESLKGAGPCIVEYKTEDGTEFLENVMVVQMKDNSFIVEIDGDRRELDGERIIRSSRKKEQML